MRVSSRPARGVLPRGHWRALLLVSSAWTLTTCGRSDQAGPHSGPGAFSDVDLRATVPETCGSGAPVVIYVWSPHMPLSVDGFATITEAADSLGLGLVPVLFPGSDASFARAEAARAGIPAEGLREVGSPELSQGDALVHAPTVLVFAGDRVSSALPGYRTVRGYMDYLERFLATSCL